MKTIMAFLLVFSVAANATSLTHESTGISFEADIVTADAWNGYLVSLDNMNSRELTWEMLKQGGNIVVVCGVTRVMSWVAMAMGTLVGIGLDLTTIPARLAGNDYREYTNEIQGTILADNFRALDNGQNGIIKNSCLDHYIRFNVVDDLYVAKFPETAAVNNMNNQF